MGRARGLIEKGVFVAWLASLFLGTRYVFGEPQAFGEAQYLEYTRFFLPLSLVTSWLFIAVFRRHAPQIHGIPFISLLLLVVAIGLSAGNAANPGLSVWWFLLLSSYSLAAVLAIFYARNVPQ